MAEITTLHGQRLKAAVDEFEEDGLRCRKNRINKTPTKRMIFFHLDMYCIAPFLLLLFLMMCTYRRQWGRNLGLDVFAENGALLHLDRLDCWAKLCYHRLCGSRQCWEEGWWKQYSAIVTAQAWAWSIVTSDSYINRKCDHYVNPESLNRPSAIPLPENPRALGLHGGTCWRWWSGRPEFYSKFCSQYCCRIGKVGDDMIQPNAFLHYSSWPTSGRHRWCPDPCPLMLQLPFPGLHPPSSSQGYDRLYPGGIGSWWWDAVPKSKKFPNNETAFQMFQRNLQHRISRHQQ